MWFPDFADLILSKIFPISYELFFEYSVRRNDMLYPVRLEWYRQRIPAPKPTSGLARKVKQCPRRKYRLP
jgi:hypothetical protein